MKKIILLLGACTLFVASCKTNQPEAETEIETPAEPLVVEKGELQNDSVYVNKTPAFSFVVDTTWHVVPEQELERLQQKAAHFVEGKAVLDNTQSIVVFMARQYETGVPMDINDSFMCAVNGREIGGEHFENSNDYFDYIQRMYRTMLPADMVEKLNYKAPVAETINGKKFDMQEMEIMLDEEKSMVERHYVRITEKYVLDFTVKFSPQEDHARLLHMLSSIKAQD